jgi:hypothetical protein
MDDPDRDGRITGTAGVLRPAEIFSLTDRVVLLTGASAGLGRRAALTFAAAGAHVIAVARRADRLRELASASSRITPLVGDLSDAEARRRVVAEAVDGHGRIDVLVNNAGIAGETDALAENLSIFDRVYAVNLAAPFDLTRHVVERRRSEEWDSPLSVINVASIFGLVAGHPVGGAAYAASKAGLIGLTRELAAQWGAQGVRVNALAPGWFPTEMNDKAFADEKFTSWVRRNTLLGRHGREQELDGALLFLASDASSYVTGQILVVDGGWTAR